MCITSLELSVKVRVGINCRCSQCKSGTAVTVADFTVNQKEPHMLHGCGHKPLLLPTPPSPNPISLTTGKVSLDRNCGIRVGIHRWQTRYFQFPPQKLWRQLNYGHSGYYIHSRIHSLSRAANHLESPTLFTSYCFLKSGDCSRCWEYSIGSDRQLLLSCSWHSRVGLAILGGIHPRVTPDTMHRCLLKLRK